MRATTPFLLAMFPLAQVAALALACAIVPVQAAGVSPKRAAGNPAVEKPEIARGPATPQAIGALHTVRGLPEACVRFEGMFTGDAAQPYRFAAVRTSPSCQPRARLVDFRQARPSLAKGWRFNDEIRVPNATCMSQAAVVRVWRKPGGIEPPKLDAQGSARIYLDEAARTPQRQRPEPALYTAEMRLEGKACGD